MTFIAATSGTSESTPPRPDAKAKRAQAAKEWMQRPITSRVHAVSGGTLTVVEVPVVDSLGSRDIQRCYVWRTEGSEVTSMQCLTEDGTATPAQAAVGPEIDRQRY